MYSSTLYFSGSCLSDERLVLPGAPTTMLGIRHVGAHTFSKLGRRGRGEGRGRGGEGRGRGGEGRGRGRGGEREGRGEGGEGRGEREREREGRGAEGRGLFILRKYVWDFIKCP